MGTLTITNSTISANSTGNGTNSGGGVFAVLGGSGGGINNRNILTITNSTISHNQTGSGAGNIGGGSGGGINDDVGSLDLNNSIVANNSIGSGGIGPDISGDIASHDYNLIQNTSGISSIFGSTAHNITGQDPLLGPLQDNGGPTPTRQLLPGSPAIDAGNSALTTDQRDRPRPIDDPAVANVSDGNASDIGAYEAHILQVNSIADTNDGACTTLDTGNGCTLREAINVTNDEGAGVITFTPALTSGGPATITLLTELPDITGNVTINGPGANLLKVSGNNAVRVFLISNGTSSGPVVSIASLTISDGIVNKGTSPSGFGGAIYNDRSTLILISCIISNNRTADNSTDLGGFGGAIFNQLGDITLTNCIVSNNQTGKGTLGGFGGAIHNFAGILTIRNSTISNNRTGDGRDNGGWGGGIFNDGTLEITNSTVSDNTTGNGTNSIAGAFSFGGHGGGISTFGPLTITNSTISNNQTGNGSGQGFGGSGGGISNDGGSVDLDNSIIGNNNVGSGGIGPDISGPIGSHDYNLIQNTSGISSIIGFTAHNITGQDPLLGPLQDNGGPTPTRQLLPGSPAIDAGNCTLVTDQRGQSRPFDYLNVTNAAGGNGSDIGAVEVSYGISATAGTPQSATINSTFSVQLKATVTESGNPQSGFTVTFTAPVSGASGTFPGNVTTTQVLTDSNGVATAPQFIANGVTGGPYSVVASLGTGLPTATFVLTNTKANQTITVNTHAPSSAVFNASSTVAAASSSGLPVSYSSSGVCTNVGATFTMTSGTGTCTVKYDQAGDTNHNAAPQVTESVTAQKANQTITFDTLASKTFGNSDFAVSATASSGLNVSFAANGNCTVTAATVHLASAGSCTITASQAGDANFNAAATVPQSFNIAKAATATIVSSLVNPSALSQSVTFTATVTSGAGTPTGTVQLKDNGTNLGAPQSLNGSGVAVLATSVLTAGTHTITADYSGDVNFLVSTGTLSAGQVVSNQALISFSQAAYGVGEGGGFLTITANRSGDTSSPVTVDYSTSDGTASLLPCSTANGLASSRCDFTTALGTLKFASGETSKAFVILISQDSVVEGPETFAVTLSNPTAGAVLVSPLNATVTFNDDVNEPSTNPADDPTEFVRHHYHDFLNREPDQSGLNFWVGNIASCGTNAQCLDVARINVSAAFFLSIEFQGTGYLVERLYKTAYGDAIATSTVGGAHQLPVPIVRLNEFLHDSQEIGLGVVVGQPGWEQALENNKQAFTAEFVERSRFTTAFPITITPAQFVDTLNANAGNPLSPSERNQLVSDLTSNAKTRAQVLRAVSEDPDLVTAESNRAFVLMQFLGYLRRNPNDSPDTDYSGYDFWLTKLNQFNGNFQTAEMVKAFITSVEYRQRSGP